MAMMATVYFSTLNAASGGLEDDDGDDDDNDIDNPTSGWMNRSRCWVQVTSSRRESRVAEMVSRKELLDKIHFPIPIGKSTLLKLPVSVVGVHCAKAWVGSAHGCHLRWGAIENVWAHHAPKINIGQYVGMEPKSWTVSLYWPKLFVVYQNVATERFLPTRCRFLCIHSMMSSPGNKGRDKKRKSLMAFAIKRRTPTPPLSLLGRNKHWRVDFCNLYHFWLKSLSLTIPDESLHNP